MACFSKCDPLNLGYLAITRHRKPRTDLPHQMIPARRTDPVCACFPEEIGLVQVHTQVTCDRKTSSQRYLIANDSSEHHCSEIDALHTALSNKDAEFWCLKHKRMCSLSASPDLVCAGFPCAPFSRQRPGRHLPRSEGLIKQRGKQRLGLFGSKGHTVFKVFLALVFGKNVLFLCSCGLWGGVIIPPPSVH